MIVNCIKNDVLVYNKFTHVVCEEYLPIGKFIQITPKMQSYLLTYTYYNHKVLVMAILSVISLKNIWITK